jgi:hypothetical protein
LEEEKTWRVKSRALWLEARDQNTKFFQKFPNQEKNFKSIWKLKDSQGNKKRGFIELVDLGVNHFKELLSESTSEKVGEMLNLISIFPRLVEEENDRYFLIEVSKEELEAIIDRC